MFKDKTLNYIFFVSLAVVIIMPFVTIRFIYPLFTKILVENTEDEAVRTARHLSSMYTSKMTEWKKESLPNDFISEIEQITENYKIEKVKVFSSSGEVIYSTAPGDIGEVNTNRYFHEVVAEGNLYTQLVQKKGKSSEGQVVSADVVETYVPVMSSSKFLGAFEIYYDITRRNQDLNTVVLYASIIPLAIMFGFLAVIVIILFILDRSISRRKQAEEELQKLNQQLKEANASKDKFFSIIAHDLRSPFTSLLGLTETLVKNIEGYSKDDIKKYIGSLQTSTKTVYTLLENLLAWSRLQRGIMEHYPEKIYLDEIAAHNIYLFQSGAEQKQISLRNLIQEETTAYADNHMVDTTLRNLISNALKFTDTGGTIEVSAQQNDQDVEVAVSDTGIGMSEEVVSKLFRLDVKCSNVGTAGEKGSGLGLLLCKELIEKNGGKIWVESEEGKGTTFRFTLPEEHGE